MSECKLQINKARKYFYVEDEEHIIEKFKTKKEAEAFLQGMLEAHTNGVNGE